MDGLAFAGQVRNRCDELLRIYRAYRTDAEIAIETAFEEEGAPEQRERLAHAEGAIEALTSLRESVTGW